MLRAGCHARLQPKPRTEQSHDSTGSPSSRFGPCSAAFSSGTGGQKDKPRFFQATRPAPPLETPADGAEFTRVSERETGMPLGIGGESIEKKLCYNRIPSLGHCSHGSSPQFGHLQFTHSLIQAR